LLCDREHGVVLISFGGEVSKIGGRDRDIGIFSSGANGRGAGATSCIGVHEALSAMIRGAPDRYRKEQMMSGAKAGQFGGESISGPEGEDGPSMSSQHTARRSNLYKLKWELWRSTATKVTLHPSSIAAWQGRRNTDASLGGMRGRQRWKNRRAITSDQDHSSFPARFDPINLRGAQCHHQPDRGDSC